MNSKRSRSKLYRLIDTFFILAPILVMIFYFVSSAFVIGYSNYSTGNFNDMREFLYNFSLNDILNFIEYQVFTVNIFDDFIESRFIGVIYDFVSDIVFYFASAGSDPFWIYIIIDYFTYIIFYELFSLMINVVMWLPRYLRNWVQEKTDTMI